MTAASTANWAAFDRPELQAGFAQAQGGCEVRVALDGMHCANCSARAERLLAADVSALRVNLVARDISFRFRPAQVRLSALLQRLDEAGLQPRVLAHEASATRAIAQRRRAFARAGVATLCAMQVMMLAWPSYFGVQPQPPIEQLLRIAQALVATPGVVWAGWPFFSDAVRALKARSLDMNVPVALALAVAYGASLWRVAHGAGALYFDTATMFVCLLTLGRLLEGRTRARAVAHLRALSERRALTAQRLGTQGLETVPINTLARGDILVVAPGDALPADGELLDARAELDESLLSGEAQAQLRVRGHALLAGSINVGAAPLQLRVSHCGGDTRLAQITQLLDLAQTQKPRLQQLSDRIAGHFVAAILLFAVIGLLLALARGAGLDAALNIALAVLVASCPCALSLAVPAALAAATDRLARAGVLVANAAALGALARIDTVLFDKTGTLTRPSMRLRRTRALAGLDLNRCQQIAAALERGYRHPIAAAFAGIASGLVVREAEQIAGAGVQGLIDGQRYWLGAAEQAPVALQLPREFQIADGCTRIMLCDTHRALACFELESPLRSEAPALIDELHRRDINCEILSGDSHDAVSAVARLLKIDQRAARQTPEQKLQRLQALQAQGRRVLAVGDGINDAPLLSAADVSAALPQGAALAQQRADLLLLGDSLTALPLAMDIAKTCNRRIRENLAWALGYNLVVLPLAMSGALSPWLAAAGMSVSSLLVVGNALRLAPAARKDGSIVGESVAVAKKPLGRLAGNV